MTWSPSKTGMGDKTVGQIIQHPTNALIFLAATSGGVYRSTDGGSNWIQSITGNFKDICFKPNDPNIVYAAQGANFYRSSNGGVSFTQITSGLTSGQRGAIAVTAANSNYVYFVQSNSSSGYKGLYRSTDAGLNFTTRSTSPNILDWSCGGSGTGGQGWYDLAITADPANAEIVYVGGVNVWKSTNGGTTWTINSHWYGGCCVPAVHADCHYLTWSQLNGQLYACNDGGIYYTSNRGTTWTDCTVTMTIGQIYKLGQSQTIKGKVINGFQDNGTYTFLTAGWIATGGGDGMECAVDYQLGAYTYHTIYYGDIFRTYNNNNEVQVAGNGLFGINESGAWVTPFILGETDPKMMFVGYKNIWRSNDVRTTNNPTWTKISNNLGGSNSSNMAVVEQSPANTGTLYAARYDNKLFRTDDCMSASPTWINLTTSLPMNATPTDLEAHPTDPNVVYMTISNYVYKSTDKGTTWTNITGNLPNIHMNSIVFYKNAPDALYVSTDAGVYYRDYFSTGWFSFSQGLPVSAEVTELEVYYDNDSVTSDVIRASTYGRGLWGSDMFSPYLADFTADSTQICPGQNVDFTDLSTGTPLSWTWSFPGGIPSSSNQQHPQNIVYNTSGSFDVSLTVNYGPYTPTRTKTGYIQVNSLTAAPSCPTGDTLLCQNNSNTQYITNTVANATGYSWVLDPATAGVLIPGDTTVVVDWSESFTGYASLKVQATGLCGSGPFSPPLMIHLRPFPDIPATPSGPTPLCQASSQTPYTTTAAANAISYVWNLSPPEAGTISGTDTIGTVTWNTAFTGVAEIKVKSSNACGESNWSGLFYVTVNVNPVVSLGKDTIISWNDTLLLDAGNQGASYLWSTGAISQTIDAYYSGNPVVLYWVNVTLNTCTSSDSITVTFTDPTGILETIKKLDVQVIPNPSRGNFFILINFNGTGPIGVRILDILGSTVFQHLFENIPLEKRCSVSLSHLPGGIYYLIASSDQERIVKKVILSK